MNLDSVRELKQFLESRVLARIEATLTARPALGRAAEPVARLTEPARTVALGVAAAGRNEFRLAVRVQKRALEESREVELIKKQAKGEVDLRYIGRINKRATRWYQQRQRPLLMGCSIGHFKVTAGTLGCFVKPRVGGSVCILSNNHVLANENRAKLGDAILQPGAYDGGHDPYDRIGKLENFVRIKRRGTNRVDCAVAAIDETVQASLTKLCGLGKLVGLGDAFLDEGTRVAKIGRTSGLTRGHVTAFELDNVVVGFDMSNVRFDDQIEIEGAGNRPFSSGGDSGSLIVNSQKRGVALLFAGSDQGGANGQGLTYANPLREVLDALEVELVL